MYGFYGEKLHDNHFWEIRGERESKILKSTCCISSNYNSDILFGGLFLGTFDNGKKRNKNRISWIL